MFHTSISNLIDRFPAGGVDLIRPRLASPRLLGHLARECNVADEASAAACIALARDRRSILLRGHSGRGWWFRTDGPDVAIERLAQQSGVDELQLRRLKKRKLRIKEEIEKLQAQSRPH